MSTASLILELNHSFAVLVLVAKRLYTKRMYHGIFVRLIPDVGYIIYSPATPPNADSSDDEVGSLRDFIVDDSEEERVSRLTKFARYCFIFVGFFANIN